LDGRCQAAVFFSKTPELPLGTDPKNIGSGLGFASKIGTELVVSVLIGTYGGFRLDAYFGSSPWLLIVGLFVGSAAGLLNLYREFQDLERAQADDDDKPVSP